MQLRIINQTSFCLAGFIQSGVALGLPPHSKPLARRRGGGGKVPTLRDRDTALDGRRKDKSLMSSSKAQEKGKYATVFANRCPKKQEMDRYSPELSPDCREFGYESGLM